MCRPRRGSSVRRGLAVAGAALAAVAWWGGPALAASPGADLPAPDATLGLPNPCESRLRDGVGPIPGPLALPCVTAEAAGDVAGAVADAPAQIADGVADSFARWIASGIAGFLETVGRAIFSGTEVDLLAGEDGGARWFLEHYDRMAAVALAVFVPMLVLAALHAVLTQSWGALGRAVSHVPLAALGTGVAVIVVQLFLDVTDRASEFLVGNLGSDAENVLTGVVAVLSQPAVTGPQGAVVGLFGMVLVGIFLAFAAFVVWLELLVREAAIYLTVLFLPLGFATYIWPALSPWLRRLVEVIVALILSKLVIVAALSLAGSALANQEGFAALVAGAGMLMLAAFAPFALFKLIPIASMGALAPLEGQGRRAAHASAAPPKMSLDYYRRLAPRSGSRTGGTGGQAGVEAPAGATPGPRLDSGLGGERGGLPSSGSAGGAAATPGPQGAAGAAGAGAGAALAEGAARAKRASGDAAARARRGVESAADDDTETGDGR